MEGTLKPGTRLDRAAKHFIIAAKLGCSDSLGFVEELYKDGLVSKKDYEGALRGHHAATVAMKSPQREEAAELYNNPFDSPRSNVIPL